MLNLLSYGAKGDGVTDDSTAVNNWFAAVISQGVPGYAPQGVYLCDSQIVFDYNDMWNKGVILYGDGVMQTVFKSAATASPAFLFYRSGGTSTLAAMWYYAAVRDMSFQGNLDGVCVSVGNANLLDQCNEMDWQANVYNANTGTASVALQTNSLYNCDFRAVVNNGGQGYGDALQLTCTAFSRFFGSFAESQSAIHITNSYSYGNVFQAVDLEATTYCITQDSANAINNTISGGQLSWSGYALNVSDGNLKIDNANFANAASSILGGTSGSHVTITGSPTQALMFTPTLPASGTSIANPTGRDALVLVWGGSVSYVSINGFGIGMPEGSFIVRVGDSISVNYSAAPDWQWYSL